MKFPTLLLPLHLLIVSGFNPDQPTLESRWDIFTPDLFFCSDSADFIFRFGMSDKIANHMVTFGLFRGDCETADDDAYNIWDNNYLVPNITKDDAPPGEGDRVRQMIVSLSPDINLLAMSPVYTVSDDGTTGTIKFCIRVELFISDLSSMVNFKEVQYAQDTIIMAEVRKLEFDMGSLLEPSPSSQNHRRLLNCAGSGGFNVVFENWWDVETEVEVIVPVDVYNVTYDVMGNSSDANATEEVTIVIAPQNALNLTDGRAPITPGFSFLLIAYECDQNNMIKTTSTVFSQGDTIRICIEPDEEAIALGLVMKEIDSAFFTRDDIPDLVQYAVEGGNPDFYGMSEVFCIPGSLKCAVETTIRAEFFASTGMIKVTGAASFEWYWESQRHLNEEYERDLQTRGVDNIGRFSLGFAITTFQETMDVEMKGPSSLQSFLLIVLSFTLILASSILFWIRDTRQSGANIKNAPAEKDLTETYKIEDFRCDDHDDHDDDYCETLNY